MQNWSDARLYLSNGLSFAEGNYFPTTFEDVSYMIVGPGIPLLVAGSKLIFDDPIWPVLVLNCLVSSLLVLVLYKLGKAFINAKAGLILAFWSVFNFSLIRVNNQILKEPYLITLVPLITLMIIFLSRNRYVVLNTVASSILFSVLIHIDERYFVYFPIVVVAILLSSKVHRRLRYALLWVAILIVSMSPWTIRNYMQFGEIVILTPRTTSFTSKLWGTNWGKNHFEDNDKRETRILYRMERANDAAVKAGVDVHEYGRIEKYYRAFYHYWKPMYVKTTFIQYGFRPVKWSFSHNLSGFVFYGVFLLFYMLGFVYAWIRRNYPILFLATIPLLHSLLHTAMIWPLERYRIPVNSLLVLVAFWFIYQVYALFCARRGTNIRAEANVF
jgi:4-amino-4-deoxy-L-arabinose transferase-like glycosyltransferase